MKMKLSQFRGSIILSVLCALIFPMAVLLEGLASAENIDPDNDDSQYSYGENVGWLNAEPSGNGGPGVLVGDSVLTGYTWAENVGWLSLSCLNTSSCFTVNYGVLNDGSGNLSGYAWGENVGWINFAPTGGGVAVDPATGNFSGKAWGENIGWISFSSAGPVSFGVTTAWRPTVSNGGFESGTSPWVFYTNAGPGAGTFANDAAGDGSAHAAHIRITTPGTNVQMYQSGLMLEANTQYLLSFKAYSNTGHDVSVSLLKHVSPYTGYGLSGRVFNLTPAWQTFTVEFTTTGFVGTVNDGRLMFWLASYDASGDHYYFDDVALEKVTAIVVPPAITTQPANQTVAEGQTTAFTVAATGTEPLSYQWQKDGVNISGATGLSYTTPQQVLWGW